jgi:hypothetical protein
MRLDEQPETASSRASADARGNRCVDHAGFRAQAIGGQRDFLARHVIDVQLHHRDGIG